MSTNNKKDNPDSDVVSIADDLVLRRFTQPLTDLLIDENINELMINGEGEIFIEKGGINTKYIDTEKTFTETKLHRIANAIASSAKQRLDETAPLLSAELPNGERVQIVIPPCVPKGKIVFSIRKHQGNVLSLDDYEKAGSFKSIRLSKEKAVNPLDQELQKAYNNKEIKKFFELCIKTKKNIVVAGDTGSGKTTFTNALLSIIPDTDRVITIEDVREAVLSVPNSVNLLMSDGNQGTADIDADRLLKTCLRLNPDRIIVSEIRGAEITSFLGAIESGHSGCITSLHAGSCDDAWRRMLKMMRMSPMNSHSTDEFLLQSLHHSIDVIIFFQKDSDGVRRPKEIHYEGT